MENEQQFEMLIQLLGQIVTTAGFEWTAEFLQGGLEAAQQGGGEMGGPEMMSQGGAQSMPPMTPQKPRNALSGQ